MSWKAPEIYDCKSENSMELYTKASDVYSFTMTMYEVLTGCKPFEALSSPDLKASLLTGWRLAVNAKPQCPGYLITFMQRC